MKKKNIIEYSQNQNIQYNTFINNARKLIEEKKYDQELFEEIGYE